MIKFAKGYMSDRSQDPCKLSLPKSRILDTRLTSKGIDLWYMEQKGINDVDSFPILSNGYGQDTYEYESGKGGKRRRGVSERIAWSRLLRVYTTGQQRNFQKGALCFALLL